MDKIYNIKFSLHYILLHSRMRWVLYNQLPLSIYDTFEMWYFVAIVSNCYPYYQLIHLSLDVRYLFMKKFITNMALRI